MRTMTAWGLFALVACCSCLLVPARAADDDAARTFFEQEIRPLLVQRCWECHGPDKQEGGLRLDSGAAVQQGGGSGLAVVPGNLEQSLLIDAVRYGQVFQMPPSGKLPPEEIALLERWVADGAYWPPEDGPAVVAQAGRTEFTDEQRQFWAFQPPADPAPPPASDAAWPRSPLDAFILARLDAAGLRPAPEADRRTLIRRATFDLTGLPPTPDEVAAFLADESPQAFERVVDRLLASPHYGEHWARHWLDVARYADSNGLDENLVYAQAWRYRDWVVQAFNRDLPIEAFITEQLAGDLLPATGDPAVDHARLTATGFLTLGAKMLAEDDPVKMEMDIVDEQLDTAGRAFLAMSLGCARCHDHKYDPFRQTDYYGLAGVFKSTQTMENFSVVAAWHERPLATPEQLAALERSRAALDAVERQIAEATAAADAELTGRIRARAGAYLVLAALLAEAAPQALAANPAALPPGAVLWEAEDFVEGNVLRDFSSYGSGIGVLVNAGPLPNVVEYDVELPVAGVYQLEVRYAAADGRPVVCLLDGRLLTSSLAAGVTGAWTPDGQQWEVATALELTAGRHRMRLERDGPFPHIDKLALAPLAAGSLRSGYPSVAAAALDRDLCEPVLQQCRAAFAQPDGAPAEPLVWLQAALRGERPAAGHPLLARLWQEPVPVDAAAWEARWTELFAQALAAWQAQQDAGQTANAPLTDVALEPLRALLADPAGPLRLPEQREELYDETVRTQLAADRAERARLEAERPQLDYAMAVGEGAPQDLRVHFRGNHLTQGEVVARRLPEIFAGDNPPPLASVGSGRLELARWLTAPDNPLTARVFVNRVWHWHFGTGLVRTCDNFGLLGERPSHPELLDWLARRFVESGWSLKRLHKEILLSATYRQSARYDAAAAQLDPDNRLLWRFSRQRLSAEALRDSILALSGQLDRTLGGTLLTLRPREYVAGVSSENKARYDSLRRSLYLPVIRSALYDVFQAFDFPEPSLPTGERSATTIAPQALFLMNGDLVLQQSRAWALALLGRDVADEERVRLAYEQCYARPPAPPETARALAFVAGQTAAPSSVPADERRVRAWQSLCKALLSSNEFLYVE